MSTLDEAPIGKTAQKYGQDLSKSFYVDISCYSETVFNNNKKIPSEFYPYPFRVSNHTGEKAVSWSHTFSLSELSD